jgi:hypothetical protein
MNMVILLHLFNFDILITRGQFFTSIPYLLTIDEFVDFFLTIAHVGTIELQKDPHGDNQLHCDAKYFHHFYFEVIVVGSHSLHRLTTYTCEQHMDDCADIVEHLIQQRANCTWDIQYFLEKS